MIKDFYLGLIPVGDWCNWRETVDNIAMTVTLHDKAYNCLRYFEQLQAKKYMDDEPAFFPNEAIMLEDNIRFRIVLSSPIYSSTNEDKNNRMILTPWKDEEMIYSEATLFCAAKIINDHSNYVLIVKSNYSSRHKENDEIIDYLIDLCNKSNKKYKIISGNEMFRYKDCYDYFLK